MSVADLFSAASNGGCDKINSLLEKGVNVDAKDDDGCTALHHAAKAGHSPALEMLLDRGVDVNATDQKGWTALHHATNSGHCPTMEQLLDRGARISAADHKGLTVLHHAAMTCHCAAIALLLDRGAIQALDKKRVEQLLADGANPNVLDDKGTALHSAASEGQTETVQHLIAAGADPCAKDLSRQTPLNLASMNGHPEIVHALFPTGAQFDNNVQASLFLAAFEGHAETVHVLLATGADANAYYGKGSTPLHSAAAEGHPETVRALVTCGANVNARDEIGRTPLHEALRRCHIDVAQILITAGTDLSVQDINSAPADNGYRSLCASYSNVRPGLSNGSSQVGSGSGTSGTSPGSDGGDEFVWSYRSTRPVLPIDSSPGSAGSFVCDPGSPCYWSAGSGCSPESDVGAAQSNQGGYITSLVQPSKGLLQRSKRHQYRDCSSKRHVVVLGNPGSVDGHARI
ncbi:ANK3 [Branchiostoma lanceolatum]|uniref:ANK3 protein n=1 Tax=Branchiostoma lanceolatum TaxID=7740 RepID=A0A8K0AII7_BRALA|nr:ANK3 [Branchiostoma lanceolatum]